jgi:hypothetical protein
MLLRTLAFQRHCRAEHCAAPHLETSQGCSLSTALTHPSHERVRRMIKYCGTNGTRPPNVIASCEAVGACVREVKKKMRWVGVGVRVVVVQRFTVKPESEGKLCMCGHFSRESTSRTQTCTQRELVHAAAASKTRGALASAHDQHTAVHDTHRGNSGDDGDDGRGQEWWGHRWLLLDCLLPRVLHSHHGRHANAAHQRGHR